MTLKFNATANMSLLNLLCIYLLCLTKRNKEKTFYVQQSYKLYCLTL